MMNVVGIAKCGDSVNGSELACLLQRSGHYWCSGHPHDTQLVILCSLFLLLLLFEGNTVEVG